MKASFDVLGYPASWVDDAKAAQAILEILETTGG